MVRCFENDIYYSTPMYDNNVSYPVTLRENQYFILCDYREEQRTVDISVQ